MVQVLNRVGGRIVTPRPNWRASVTEEFAFKTGIFTSEEGWEEREALRTTARVNLQYRTLLTREGLQRHMADTAEDPSGLYIVPVTWRNVDLASAAAAGQADLSVAEVPYWLVPGANVVISDGSTEEAGVVTTVVGTTASLASNLQTNFSAGHRVYLAYPSRAQKKNSFQAQTTRVWEGNLRFEVKPASVPQPTAAATPPTFEGRELFLSEPNWRSAPRIEFEDDRLVFDPTRGKTDVRDPRVDVMHNTTLSYVGLGHDKSENLIAFFLRMKGRRTGFYMPTWQEDFEIAAAASAGSNYIDTPGSEFRAAYEGSNTYNVIAVRRADGSYQVNRISGFSDAGFNTRLTLVDNWTQDVATSDLVSFCPQWRFASDSLTVSWLNADVAEIDFALQTVFNEEVV